MGVQMPMEMPISEISNWLHRSVNGIENIVRNKNERLLTIGFYKNGIQNAREMVDQLKTV